MIGLKMKQESWVEHNEHHSQGRITVAAQGSLLPGQTSVLPPGQSDQQFVFFMVTIMALVLTVNENSMLHMCVTRSHLAFATLPLLRPSVTFLKLTASSRLSAPPSGSPKCLRFGLWLTLTHSLTAARNRLWVVAPSMLTGHQQEPMRQQQWVRCPARSDSSM